MDQRLSAVDISQAQIWKRELVQALGGTEVALRRVTWTVPSTLTCPAGIWAHTTTSRPPTQTPDWQQVKQTEDPTPMGETLPPMAAISPACWEVSWGWAVRGRLRPPSPVPSTTSTTAPTHAGDRCTWTRWRSRQRKSERFPLVCLPQCTPPLPVRPTTTGTRQGTRPPNLLGGVSPAPSSCQTVITVLTRGARPAV